MKRCPQCEFIYEDDQSLCDMDGVLLVLDARTLPSVQAPESSPVKSQKRKRTVPVFATLILALVLGMVYYVSTQRKTQVPPSAETMSIPAPAAAAEPAPILNPTPEAKPSEPPPTKQPAATPGRKPVTKTTAAVSQPTRRQEPKKADSKVNSILKKTGRILKKPFKF
jgi:cytoskeletal protein RodZ